MSGGEHPEASGATKHRQTDIQTAEQTDRQTERKTESKEEREIDSRKERVPIDVVEIAVVRRGASGSQRCNKT